MLNTLKQRQEEDDSASGSCDDLYNKAVGDQCETFVTENNMDCSTVFTNPDNSTSTLEEICEKTCCQDGQAGAGSNTAEKRAKQLLFDFKGM